MAKYLLTASQVKSLKTRPGKKITKYHDGEGLYLWVNDTDNYKRWFFRYTNKAGTRKDLLLGTYPLVSLEEARKRADEARINKERGIDPVEHRRAKKVAEKSKLTNSFEVVAREWFNTKRLHLSESTRTRDMANLENDILPAIGSMSISEITPPMILAMLRKIEARGAGQTAHRTRSQCSMIFRYGVATERCSSDPCRDLVDALKPTTKKHRAAITDMARFAELLRAIDGYRGTAIVKTALKLAPLLAVRPGELRFAKWKDINFNTREWTFQAEKTKVDHIAPLPRQAIEFLNDLKKITYENDESYLFPQLDRKGRVMSENTLVYALRGLGFSGEEMTAHGFRTTAKTELLELGYPLAWLEKMLAHAPKESHGRAYNRTEYRQQRHQMMQAWADYMDELRSDVERDITKLRKKHTYRATEV